MLDQSSPAVSAPVEAGVFERISQWVDKQPDKLLYAFLKASGEPTAQYTYGEFWHRLRVIASHLASTSSLVPGDRLVLLYAPGLEMVCALFACARAGFIAVPAPPLTDHGFLSEAHQLSHIIEDSGAAAILMDRETRQTLAENLGREDSLADPAVKRALCDPGWIQTDIMREMKDDAPARSPDEIFCLQYTSGSTNDPKGVIVTHEGILHNCSLVAEYETPVTVTWLPQHHDMGLIGYYIYPLLAGGTTYGFSPATFIRRPALWLETISKHRAIASSAPNFAFELCLDERRVPRKIVDGLDLSCLKFLMAAAEPIKVDTYRRFIGRFEPVGLDRRSFFVAYGLAEFTLAVTNHGRSFLRLSKRQLAAGHARSIENASQIADTTQIMSCGRPLRDTLLKIVGPNNEVLADNQVGEIWISGKSACRGYWRKPGLTAKVFHARISGPQSQAARFLRTGDMGFMHDGELFVCGRRKDMMIIRGQNHYAEDIEHAVEESFPELRKGGVAAFEVDGEEGAGIALVAEISNGRSAPDPRAVIQALREKLSISVARVVLVGPRSVVRTSSGKVRRFKTKELLLDGKLKLVADHQSEATTLELDDDDLGELSRLKKRYNLTGEEDFTLLDAGIDSFDIVVFLHWLQETLAENGALGLSDKVDAKLLGAVSIRQIFLIARLLAHDRAAAIAEMRRFLSGQYEEHLALENEMMLADRFLDFEPQPAKANTFGAANSILLTGGSGFLGPFLLANLLKQTEGKIYVLVRASDEDQALARIRHGLAAAMGSNESSINVPERVVPLMGDLERDRLGLDPVQWDELVSDLDTIYHNAASVNYILDYRRMRQANVAGVNQILKLALAGRPKQFNHISTTFIFGWAQKDVLLENDHNDEMQHLDFGYSQSKWVSEQLVHDAKRKGLAARIFRPSLVTPSIDGGGDTLDITLRLLSFMIKHGIGVTSKNQLSFMPAEVAANNIVSIANDPRSIGGVFHITRDDYENIIDVTDLITEKTGRQFEKFDIKEFVPEVIRRCTTEDSLFPLLDFLIDSVDKIAAMEDKRYDSSAYQAARNASRDSIADPPLNDVVDGILRFLNQQDPSH